MIDVDGGNMVYYYHFDGLGSVAALSDVNNVIVERYSYDVFGAPTIYDVNSSEISQSAIGNPYMFTARRADDETALYYYRARYYAFDIGRFLQTDPIGYYGNMNLYTYCGNNPILFNDPWGLLRWIDPPRPRDNFWGPVWDICNAGRDVYHAGASWAYGAGGVVFLGLGELQNLPPSEPFSSQAPPVGGAQYVAILADYATLGAGLLGEKADIWADQAFDNMRYHAIKSHNLAPGPENFKVLWEKDESLVEKMDPNKYKNRKPIWKREKPKPTVSDNSDIPDKKT